MARRVIPKISVIVPVYKTEAYIERCARSLFEQTMSELEFIFVNDCTPDNSILILEKIISEYPDRISDIHCISHSQNLGISSVRNSGLAVAVGEYIYYCDSDDWVEVDMMSRMYETAYINQADIVWCDYYNSYPEVDKLVKQENSENSLKCIKSLLLEKMHGAVWNKLVKRVLYIEHNIKFPDGLNLCEDLRITIQLFFYASRCVYLPQAYYHYVQYNTNSLCTTFSEKKLGEIIENINGIISFLERNKVTEVTREINYIKLAAKQTLLFQMEKHYFSHWRELFPESNRYIMSYAALPLHLRLLGCCVWLRLWPLIDLWVFLKKKYKRR